MKTSPVASLVDEMNGCVAAGLYFGAISLGVALPSVCASLEMEDGRAQGAEYLQWCANNLYPEKGFDLITPEELLSLRNGFTHQNRSELKNNKKGRLEEISDTVRVVFIMPGQRIQINNSTGKFGDDIQSYVYNLDNFCERMGAAVIAWLESKSGNHIVQHNLKQMATYRSMLGSKAIY